MPTIDDISMSVDVAATVPSLRHGHGDAAVRVSPCGIAAKKTAGISKMKYRKLYASILFDFIIIM